MSYKVVAYSYDTLEPIYSDVVLSTIEEAESYLSDLATRWNRVRKFVIERSSEIPNSIFQEGTLVWV